jgi:hypothetical protein
MTQRRVVPTYSRGSAKINEDFAFLQKVKFLVQLNDFEGGTSTVSLLFGKLVPFVQAAFAVLLLDTHNGEK